MIFSKAMYWGEHASKRKHYILENLREGRFQMGAYIVTPGKNGNLYEIYPAAALLNPGLDTEELLVIGIGYGYRDTLLLIKRMVCERFLGC